MIGPVPQPAETKPVSFVQPPYLLEKQPNLLCYNLYLPLTKSSGVRAAVKLTDEPTKLQHSAIDPRVPTLTVSRRLEDAGCNLNVYRANPKNDKADFRNAQDYELILYCVVPLDCKVDIDRSTLRMHGPDYLSARLPFSSASEAAMSRMERSLIHPAPSELDQSWYDQGLLCRQCNTQITKPNRITKATRAAATPWNELLQNVTCVAPEEYLGKNADPAFGVRHVVPTSGKCLVGDAVLAFHPQDIDEKSIIITRVKVGSRTDGIDEFTTSDDYRVSGPNMALRPVVQCAKCRVWIGDATHVSAETSTHNHSSSCCDGSPKEKPPPNDSESKLAEIRLFKSSIHCSGAVPEVECEPSASDAPQVSNRDPFEMYNVDSLIGSFMADASMVRDCKRFVLSESNCETGGSVMEPIPRAKLVLLGVDNWIQTHDKDLRPMVKVLYMPVDKEDIVDCDHSTSEEEHHLDNTSSVSDRSGVTQEGTKEEFQVLHCQDTTSIETKKSCSVSDCLNWACAQGAELVVLENAQCDEILEHLEKGNRLLPPSVREFFGMFVGYLDW